MTPNLIEGLKLGSRTSPLILKLTEYQGHRLIDIRKYFVTKTDGTEQPTRKGISLGGRMLQQVFRVLEENMREIMAWLDEDISITEQQVYHTMNARLSARQELARQSSPIITNIDTWQSPTFFKVQSLGGTLKVSFNNSHPIIANLGTKPIAKEALIELLGKIFASHHRAKSLFPGDEDYNSNLLFDEVEFEWGKIASNYVNSPSL